MVRGGRSFILYKPPMATIDLRSRWQDIEEKPSPRSLQDPNTQTQLRWVRAGLLDCGQAWLEHTPTRASTRASCLSLKTLAPHLPQPLHQPYKQAKIVWSSSGWVWLKRAYAPDHGLHRFINMDAASGGKNRNVANPRSQVRTMRCSVARALWVGTFEAKTT